jgi:hypothetical protein
MREARTEINLLPKVKYGFHRTDFHETHINSIFRCKRLLYGILSKSEEKYDRKGKILLPQLGIRLAQYGLK